MHFELKERPGYKLEISGDFNALQKMCKDLFEGEVYTRYRIKHGKQQGKLVEKISIESLAIVDWARHCLLVDFGFYQEVILWLYDFKETHENVEYKINFDIFYNLQIIEKWKARYLDYDPMQLEIVENMLQNKSASCQYPTGLGKTEMFLGIVESFLEQETGNVIITTGKDAILDTILQRMDKWEIPTNNPRLRILNPIGFCRSNDFDSQKTIEWLVDVKLVIVDEMHHAAAESYSKLYSRCMTLQHVFGFSGTISFDDIVNYSAFQDINIQSRKLIGRTGACAVQLLPKDKDRKIEYVRVSGNFGTDSDAGNDFHAHARAMCSNRNFINCISQIIRSSKSNVFFIGIPHIESGLELVKILESKYDLKLLHFGGGNCYPNIDSYSGKNSVEKMASAIVAGDFRGIVATSSMNEGVDIPSLNSAILTFSKDWKASLQILGRSGRGKGAEPLIFNVCNNDDALLKKQYYERNRVIRDTYIISRYSNMKYEDK